MGSVLRIGLNVINNVRIIVNENKRRESMHVNIIMADYDNC